MSQPPAVPRPVADPESTEPQPAGPAKAAVDLTVNKVLAGAGAAATSAVLGSYFGATGTVAGAALGSVASTVATTLYQRSLDHTRDRFVARVRLPVRRTDSSGSEAPTVQLTAPQVFSPDDATTVLRVEPVLRRPRRVWLWIGATVLVFVIGLLVVTGIEWAKGSTLTTGESGTSVGRVLTPGTGHSDRNATESDSEAPTSSAEPTEAPTSTAESTPSAEESEEPSSTAEPGIGAEPSAPARSADRTTTPLPTSTSPENR